MSWQPVTNTRDRQNQRQLLYLLTQICFPNRGKRVKCHESKLTNSPGRTKLTNSLQKQQHNFHSRDQVGLLETAPNLWASRRKTNDCFAVSSSFQLWGITKHLMTGSTCPSTSMFPSASSREKVKLTTSLGVSHLGLNVAWHNYTRPCMNQIAVLNKLIQVAVISKRVYLCIANLYYWAQIIQRVKLDGACFFFPNIGQSSPSMPFFYLHFVTALLSLRNCVQLVNSTEHVKTNEIF